MNSETDMVTAALGEPLLRVRDCAAYAGMHEQEVYRAVREGRLPVMRLGPRRLRIRPEDFKAFLRELEESG